MSDLPPHVLARMYPEVLIAHAEFGGDLLDMLLKYHRAVLADMTKRNEHE